MKTTTFKFAALSGALAAALLSGCAVGYDVLRERAQDGCKGIADYLEHKACMARNQESYADYEKKRQKLLNERKTGE